MTRTKIDLSPERILITNLIISLPFAREIFPILKSKNLKTRYARVLADWVREYYDAYNNVPGKLIRNIYEEKKASILGEEEQDSVEEFIDVIFDSVEEAQEIDNLQYRIESAINYLKLCTLETTIEKLQESVKEGDPLKGESVIANFSRVGRPVDNGFSVLDGPGEIIEAFLTEDEVVLNFPGDLGKVIGSCNRGDFISFLAGYKIGKSWSLLYSAEIAASLGHQVTFVTLEMYRNQIIRRAWQSYTASPRYEQVVTIPYFVADKEANEEENEDTMYRIEYKDIKKEGVNFQTITETQESLKRLFKGGDCKFFSLPQKATTIKDIEALMDNLFYYDNYLTDVLVIDYADLLGAKNMEYRHQIDDIWANLKRIAQERNILVVTASQVNAGGLDGTDITGLDTAEDKRKLGHVSKMIALNQTAEEKEKQCIRWTVLYERDEPYKVNEATVLQCLKIGRAYLDSRMKGRISR